MNPELAVAWDAARRTRGRWDTMTGMTVKDQQRHQARCVIWRTPDAVVPEELRTALQQRKLWFTECDSAAWATAELCRISLIDDSIPVILLLLHPEDLTQTREVLEVCDRYAPQATHWVFDEGTKPRLRTLVGAQVAEVSESGSINPDTSAQPISTTDIPETGCENRQESPSILSMDELTALKHPDQAGDPST